MTNLKKRERAKTNASLISMVQRFSDITIMFAGLWLVCEVSGLSFLYMHLLVALITLVVFQMLGGITDFYRSWRGVRAATEFALLLQNLAGVVWADQHRTGGLPFMYSHWGGLAA